ncbi:unnamed protein product [Notodromas monacha]|uniref:Uncharacterized protein n=1 Tax=Notodromas monacha TaxID=399045 RepID=A0A7R9BUR7_9CRUS|nr:unnamed protein product [Notodromas monacha]CAG0922088.1 unnamed protein product [Notodromas monacha]
MKTVCVKPQASSPCETPHLSNKVARREGVSPKTRCSTENPIIDGYYPALTVVSLQDRGKLLGKQKTYAAEVLTVHPVDHESGKLGLRPVSANLLPFPANSLAKPARPKMDTCQLCLLLQGSPEGSA